MGRVNTAGRMLAWGMGWTLGAVAGGALGQASGILPPLVTRASVSLISVLVAWTSPLHGLRWRHLRAKRPAAENCRDIQRRASS